MTSAAPEAAHFATVVIPRAASTAKAGTEAIR